MSSYTVVADKMYDKSITFKCPFCLKKHYIGNCGDFCSNRDEIRGSAGHCSKFDGLYKVLVCTSTIRELNPRNTRIYNQYLKHHKNV